MDRFPVRSTRIRDININTLSRVKKPLNMAARVASNIRCLKESASDSLRDLAKRSGVSKSTLQRIIDGEQSATVEQAEKIAKAYGIDGWNLLLPTLPQDVTQSEALSELVADFFRSSPEGKQNIRRIAEMESGYSKAFSAQEERPI